MPTKLNEGKIIFLTNSAAHLNILLQNKAGHQPHTICKNEPKMDQIPKYDTKSNKTL